MGMLDGILGNVLNSALGGGRDASTQNPLGAVLGQLGLGGNVQQAGLMAAAFSLLQSHGGLNGVLDMFRRNGLGQHADSWLSTGPNMGISADQVHQVFGAASLGNFASQLGISHGQAGSALAQLLPELINQFTPQGQLPDDVEGLLSKGLAALRGAAG